MHVNGLHEWFRPAKKANADTRREDLGEAVEAEDSAHLRLLELEREVGGYAWCITKVEVVVRVIYEKKIG